MNFRRWEKSEIPYSTQTITRADLKAVRESLRSKYLTQGNTVPRFENAVLSYVGADYSVAVSNATSALHIACLALGVGKGDIVWTSAITFVASANCAVYCGAEVDFVDIEQETYNMSVSDLHRKLQVAAKSGRLPKVVIPVHLTGQPCDMEGIRDLARQFGFRIIEDASHAIGARYKGAMIGKCEFSDVTIFSFHPVKIITTGEGGMAVTNDVAIADRMRSLRSHGITRDRRRMLREPDGPWYYEQLELGYNYRMTDIQAALGLSQLRRIETFLAQRRKIARIYDNVLAGLNLTTPQLGLDCESAHHLYVVQLDADKRLRAFEELRDANVMVNLHYIPVYRQPFYSKFGYDINEYPNSEKYYSQAMSLPIFPKLTKSQALRVCDLMGALVA